MLHYINVGVLLRSGCVGEDDVRTVRVTCTAKHASSDAHQQTPQLPVQWIWP